MRKRYWLPLLFFVPLASCNSGNVSSVKGTIDHVLAVQKLSNYNQFVNLENHKTPETLKLKSEVDELSFHEQNLTDAEIELQIDTRYALGLEKETFPYAHFFIKAVDEKAHIFAYESWVFVEARNTGNVVNVYERGTEFQSNVRSEYVFESKRDWTDKASDCLAIMNEEIHNSALRIHDTIKAQGEAGAITKEDYDEPSAGGLIGNVVYSTSSDSSEELYFKFENYILQSYKHKTGKKTNTSEAKWDVESIVKDTPKAEDFTLQKESGLTKAIR